MAKIGVFGAVVVLCWGGIANATRMALEPLNRVHAGLSYAGPSSMGLMFGMDSRLTQLIYVDVTGFMSVSDPVAEFTVPDEKGQNTWMLRHGLICMPGVRIPHKQPETWSWDVLTRGGFGAVWLADSSVAFDVEANPALLAGGDLVLRKSAVGFRLTARAVYSRPYSKFRRAESAVVRPQYGSEVFYQF
ncbi:MAG TPA: hypothetical protein EYN66_12720 [Myxococcales bacterium]|nr:hypothetical protein [Myxococcales bacterium]